MFTPQNLNSLFALFCKAWCFRGHFQHLNEITFSIVTRLSALLQFPYVRGMVPLLFKVCGYFFKTYRFAQSHPMVST